MAREKEGNSVIVSHRKDADGIACAALTKFLVQGKVTIYLTDYADMNQTISNIKDGDDFYVSDLGLNANTFPSFLEQMKRLGRLGKVHYTDHHPIDSNFEYQLKEVGVDLYHSVEECASILLFKKYAAKLEDTPRMKILACTGAITDYLDSQPFAKRLIASFDRQFLLYEATVLSFTIATFGRVGHESDRSLIRLVEELAEEKLPHQIENASSFAQSYASRSAQLIEKVKLEGKKRKNFAYFFTTESATGNVANFLIGAFGVPVGVAVREEEPGYLEISMRSTDASKTDLGKVAGNIAMKLNTSGGGHPRASGARIRDSHLEEFLDMLDEELSKSFP